MNEEDGINQSQIKEKLIEFSNQSHRHHSDIDTTAIEQSHKMNEINQYPHVSLKKSVEELTSKYSQGYRKRTELQ